MSSLNRAFFFSFSNRYLSLLLDLGLVVIISRILKPDEIGIYSLAMGSVAIGQMLREFGLSLYIIKEKDLTKDKIQGCFTISIILCWALGAIYLLLANTIGDFYDSHQVTTVVQVLSINFFFLPFSTLIISLFNRNMQFGINMLIMVVGNIVRVFSTLIFLYFETNVISLAWGAVIGTVSNLMFAVYYGEWKYYKFNFRFIKEILKFTSFVSSSNIFTQFGTIYPEIMIGKFLSAEKVAYFGKGTATINLFKMLILQVIGNVVSPVISKLNHKNTDMSSSVYAVYNYVLVFQWPFYLCLILFAEDLVRILYGPQWSDVVELTQIMAFFMLFEGFIVLSNRLLNTLGDVKYSFKVTLLIMLLQVLVVIVFIEQGLVAVAYACSCLVILKVVLLLPRIIKLFKLSKVELAKIYLKNALIALCVFIMGYYSQILFQEQPLFIRTVINGGILLLTWIGVVFLFSHPIKNKIIQGTKFIFFRSIP